MTDTSGTSESGSVLRPFEQRPMEPLPPVEPSKVVPVDRMPRVPDSITPEDVTEADNDPPVEGDVGILEEYDDTVVPDDAVDDDDVGDDSLHDGAFGDDADEFWGPLRDDEDAEELDIDFLAGRPVEATLAEEEAPVEEAPGEDHAEEPSESSANPAPATADSGSDDPAEPVTPSDTVTLPRRPFLIGAGVVGLVLVVLFALWQTAGGDGGDTSGVAGDATRSTLPPASTADSGDADQPDADPVTDPSAIEDVAQLQSEVSGLNAEVSGLNAQVETLQSQLDSQPPPALPGDALLRVPVASGSKFISAEGQSIAVVSPFGGYANIEAGTNVVNASGKVAEGGTRVLRTPTSVWITNYADSQLIRVDPLANSVADVFAFPAPDGLAKYGDALLVTSYDGGFLGGVDPTDGEIVEQVALGGSPTDVLVTDDAIWVTLFDTGELVKVDLGDFFVADRIVVGAGPVGLWSTQEGLWVVNHEEGTVVLVDPLSLEIITTIDVGEGPTDVLSAFGKVWVTVTDSGSLVEIDPKTGDIVTMTPLGGTGLGGGPVGIEHTAGSLWIAMDREDSVVRVTPPS